MTAQSLPFLCRNEIHRFLGLETRMDLIKLVPALRSQNKKLEYHLNRVLYNDRSPNEVYLIVDKTEIVIMETTNENNDQTADVVVEIQKTYWTPTSLRRVEFKNCEQNAGIHSMAEKMIAFYLDRPGTVVHGTVRGIRWEHLRKWRNCIRMHNFATLETISTTGWCRELFRKVRAPEFELVYDSTPGVLLEIVKTVNSDLPIGTSVKLSDVTKDKLGAVQQLQHDLPGAITDSGWSTIPDHFQNTWLKVRYPGYDLLVALARRSFSSPVTVTKRERAEEI